MPNGGMPNAGWRSAETGGFLGGAWFGIRNFIGGGLLAAGFGAAIALICLAIGVVLWAIIEGITWLVRLV
jgi:hypothetical protein